MTAFAIEAGPDPIDAGAVRGRLERLRGQGGWDTDEVHSEPGLVIAARARWLVPEDEGRDAVAVDETRGLVAVWDGRLDNRDDVLAALRAAAGSSPAEVAIAAFAKWGDEAPRHMLGDFAFAVFSRAERRLYVTRDILGIRPLYYGVARGNVRVASSERAICGDDALPCRPNARVLSAALAGAAVLDEETLYEGVRPVHAASTLVVRNGSTSLTRYPTFDLDHVDETISRADHVARARLALEHAVASRIRGHRPVASQASGGLDSSSVIAIAAHQLREAGQAPPLLLHMRAEGMTCDESRFARSLAARVGAPLIEADARDVSFGPQTVEGEVDLGGPWCGPYRELYREASKSGARVVLTGEGSDEIQLRHGLEIDDALRRSSWLEAARFAGLVEQPLSRTGWKKIGVAMRRSIAPRRVERRVRAAREAQLPTFLTPAARRAALEGLERLERRDENRPPLREALGRELRSTVGMTLILQEVQQFASFHGLELAHPFLDRRVVEVFLAMPAKVRASFDTYKPVLRSAMAQDLPPAVLWRFPPTDYTELHERAWRTKREEWIALARSSRLADLGLVSGDAFLRSVGEAFDGELTADVTNALELEGWLARSGR